MISYAGMYVCMYNLICTILDDDLRSTDAPALPFQAFGALGMARLDIANLLHEFANDRMNRSERVVPFNCSFVLQG